MKIRLKINTKWGRQLATAGTVIDVPAARARVLIAAGHAEAVSDPERSLDEPLAVDEAKEAAEPSFDEAEDESLSDIELELLAAAEPKVEPKSKPKGKG